MSDKGDPGFFGYGFDSNGDGSLDAGEQANDLAQFMDSYGNDILSGGSGGGSYTGSSFKCRSYVPFYTDEHGRIITKEEWDAMRERHAEERAEKQARRIERNKALLKVVPWLSIPLVLVAVIAISTAIMDNGGIFDGFYDKELPIAQELSSVEDARTCEVAGVSLPLSRKFLDGDMDLAPGELAAGVWYIGDSIDDGWAIVDIAVRERNREKTPEGETMDELEYCQVYDQAFPGYSEVDVPGAVLAFRYSLDTDRDQYYGLEQRTFFGDLVVVVRAQGGGGYFTKDSAPKILNRVDYSGLDRTIL